MTTAERRKRTGEALGRVTEHMGYQPPEATWREIRRGLLPEDRVFVNDVVFLYLRKLDVAEALSRLGAALDFYDRREAAARESHPAVGRVLDGFEGSTVAAYTEKKGD